MSSYAAMIVKQFNQFKEAQKLSGPRRFHYGSSWSSSSRQKKVHVGGFKKFYAEKKNDGKCFNYRGTDHFAKD